MAESESNPYELERMVAGLSVRLDDMERRLAAMERPAVSDFLDRYCRGDRDDAIEPMSVEELKEALSHGIQIKRGRASNAD